MGLNKQINKKRKFLNKKRLALNINFTGTEIGTVMDFKEKNPTIQHREIYLAGIQALGEESTKK